MKYLTQVRGGDIMCKPHPGTTLTAVLDNVIRAQGALNMAPQPIENMGEHAEFLSEKDVWAKHAYEHLNAAAKALVDVINNL